MYYPIQIPYILNHEYSKSMKYKESLPIGCENLVICFWEMQPLSDKNFSVTNVIVTDACIDIVVDCNEKTIGFVGMSKTEFNFTMDLPTYSFGARMMPGAFHKLTGLPATMAMDTYLPFDEVFNDFNQAHLFSLSFEQAKEHLHSFLSNKSSDISPDLFTELFNTLSEDIPQTTKELYEILHFSPRQCQRLFAKHYGITPKMALSILRFQKCLKILISSESKPANILDLAGYYDQPHFNKDFKRNIGITPLELIRTYHNY